jgi:hypothetical protein
MRGTAAIYKPMMVVTVAMNPPFKMSEVVTWATGAEAAKAITPTERRRAASVAEAWAVETGAGGDAIAGAATIAWASASGGLIAFRAPCTLATFSALLRIFPPAPLSAAGCCARAAGRAFARTGHRHVRVDEVGHRLELVFAQLTVAVLIELVEHLLRLGHAGRAAGTGAFFRPRTFFWPRFVGGLIAWLVALLLGGGDSQLADLAAGGFAFFVAEFAVAVFVELLQDLFFHAGVRIAVLFGVLVVGLGHGGNRQQRGGHEHQTRD